MEEIKEKILREIGRRRILTDYIESNLDRFVEIGITPSIMGPSMIDLDNPSREQVIKAIKLFPGKWEKSKSGVNMSYTLYGNITLRLWNTGLPPSCKVVLREVEVPAQEAVPAHTKMVEEIVCLSPLNEEEVTQ